MPIEIPALDGSDAGGDFEHLTITGQLDVVRRTVGATPAVLMGSSLGGYLAALFAVRYPDLVQKLVLLAPAFEFPRRFGERYTKDELDRWRAHGSVSVFHYGYNGERNLGYQLLEDSLNYEDTPDFRQPALIFHGTQDPVVPIGVSEVFAASHPNVTLRRFDSGHELTEVLQPMWEGMEAFLFQNL